MRANKLATYMTRNGLTATCFVCLLIAGTGRAHGLDPSKRLTQYRMCGEFKTDFCQTIHVGYRKRPTDFYGLGVQRLDSSALTVCACSMELLVREELPSPLRAGRCFSDQELKAMSPTSTPIWIFAIDDHLLFRNAIGALLAHSPRTKP
jgi:hypothetical protein